MSDSVVVDTSLAVKWVIEEEYSTEATVLLTNWIDVRVVRLVPAWFACETTNVLLKHLRRGTLDRSRGGTALRTLLGLTTPRDVEPLVSVRALDIAISLAQPASYDSQYLALAEHLDCELWTADEWFWNTAKTAFPRVRWVGEVVTGEPPSR